MRRYWDARPCNIRHSPKPVGSQEYFDEVEARKYLVEPHIPGFAEFERWRGKRVLEVGCGIGTDSINFARAGAELTAVDLSGESLRIAEQRAEVMGVADRIQFVQANAEELASALDGEQYDLVYSFGVIHHTPHPERALAQMRALAAPGGDAEADGLPPALVEGLLDRSRRRSAAASGTRTSSSRSTRRPRPAVRSRSRTRGARRASSSSAQGFRVAKLDGRPRLPLPHPRLRRVPLREGAVLPLDAGSRCSAAFERSFGWHLLDHGGGGPAR